MIIVPICRTQASPQSEQKQTNLQWQNVKFLFRRPFPKRACKRSFFSPSCFFLPPYITSNQNSRLRYDGERRKRMSSFDPPQPPSDRQKSPKCLRWRLLLLLFSFWKFRVGVEGSFGGGGGVLCDVPEPLLLLLGNSEGGRRGKRGFLHLVQFPPFLADKAAGSNRRKCIKFVPQCLSFQIGNAVCQNVCSTLQFSLSR